MSKTPSTMAQAPISLAATCRVGMSSTSRWPCGVASSQAL
jgi:hypothetical protein